MSAAAFLVEIPPILCRRKQSARRGSNPPQRKQSAKPEVVRRPRLNHLFPSPPSQDTLPTFDSTSHPPTQLAVTVRHRFHSFSRLNPWRNQTATTTSSHDRTICPPPHVSHMIPHTFLSMYCSKLHQSFDNPNQATPVDFRCPTSIGGTNPPVPKGSSRPAASGAQTRSIFICLPHDLSLHSDFTAFLARQTVGPHPISDSTHYHQWRTAPATFSSHLACLSTPPDFSAVYFRLPINHRGAKPPSQNHSPRSSTDHHSTARLQRPTGSNGLLLHEAIAPHAGVTYISGGTCPPPHCPIGGSLPLSKDFTAHAIRVHFAYSQHFPPAARHGPKCHDLPRRGNCLFVSIAPS